MSLKETYYNVSEINSSINIILLSPIFLILQINDCFILHYDTFTNYCVCLTITGSIFGGKTLLQVIQKTIIGVGSTMLNQGSTPL
jgi:hypothetical protein